MSSSEFLRCYARAPLMLTEGAVGLRMTNEFGLACDGEIMHASHIYTPEGRKALTTIYGQYCRVAEEHALPILLFTNTRRANKERVTACAYREKDVMTDYAGFLREIVSRYKCEAYIGGIIGCKGDGYTGEGCLAEKEAADFHAWQMEAFVRAGVDLVFAALMPTIDETIGMTAAIAKSDLPYIISFMVRENGTIPDGNSLHEAITAVDNSARRKPLCYMTNCVHPIIVLQALRQNNSDIVRNRFRGIQANAAYLPPEELDRPSCTISSGAGELAKEIAALHREFPLKIVGGCCGTDDTHLHAFAKQLTQLIF